MASILLGGEDWSKRLPFGLVPFAGYYSGCPFMCLGLSVHPGSQAERGNQAWWHKPVILIPGREDCEFKASLGYVVSLCSRNKTNAVDRTDFEASMVAQFLHVLHRGTFAGFLHP